MELVQGSSVNTCPTETAASPGYIPDSCSRHCMYSKGAELGKGSSVNTCPTE